MTTIGLSYSLVKISTKCAPALVYTRIRGDNYIRIPCLSEGRVPILLYNLSKIEPLLGVNNL